MWFGILVAIEVMIVRDGNQSVIEVVKVKEMCQGERAGDTKEKGSN
jgi:hypothetical protein